MLDIKMSFDVFKLARPNPRVFLAFLLFLCIAQAKAQNELIKFENYSKDDGIIHSQILSICQDKEGILWIGSYGGLNKFDGTNFKSYTTDNSDLPNNMIFSILEPKNGQKNILWLGTNQGLIKFNKKTNSFGYYEKVNSRIFSIAEGEDGKLWLATLEQGLWMFDPESKEFSSTALSSEYHSSPSASSINCFYYEQTGILWLGADKGSLFKYDCRNDSYERILEESGTGNLLSPYNISCLHKMGSKILIGTIGGGLYAFDKAQKSLANISQDLSGNEEIHKSITSITDDNTGNVWISSFGGGLYRIEGIDYISNGRKNYKIRNFRRGDEGPDNICSNLLNLVYKDYTGNIWIGSEGGGLSKIDFFKHRISHFMIEEPGGKRLRDNNISAVFEDVSGDVWFGVRNRGLYVYDIEKDEYRHILLFPKNFNDRRNFVHDIYGDKYQRIWVSTDLGIFLFRGSSVPEHIFKLDVPVANSVIRNAYVTMCLDKNDALWFSNGENRLFRMNSDEIEKADPENVVITDYTEKLFNSANSSSFRIWGITQDSNGNIWIASSAGLYRYSFKRDDFEHLFTTGINNVFEPEKGSGDYIWMGTYGEGIFLFNKSNLSSINFNTSTGLCHNNISGIIEDRQGNIWLSTAKGIASIYTKGLYSSEFHDMENESNMIRIRNYWKSDGLQAHEFNINAVERLSNGKLVFGGPNGFNLFDPLAIEDNKYACSVFLMDFKIFNKSILGDTALCPGSIEYLKELKLNYKQNYFTIDFTAICFTSPEEVKYHYMLEGFDNEWITVDAAHASATYTKIKSDDYIFKVKASNPDGFENDECSVLNISIDPPFWETLHIKFIGLIFISLMVILIILYQKRLISRQKNRDLQSQKERFEKEKLRSELDNKNRELAITTMFIVKKNEKLIQVRNMMSELKEHIQSDNKLRYMEILSSIDNDVKNQDKWESFELNFNLIHNNFIARLIEKYPTLSHNDVKICAYMRMNLSSKEIANLLNITPKSLETNRVRIRKRMKLECSVYLSNYIMRF